MSEDSLTDRLSELYASQSDELAQLVTGPYRAVLHRQVMGVANLLRVAWSERRTAYVAGNGGSAEQALHMAAEFVWRYYRDRPSYPMVALTANMAVVTGIADDRGFEYVFRRQLEVANSGDVFIGLSTSGNSPNVICAAEYAREQRIKVVGFSGIRGHLKELSDAGVFVPSDSTARIQEIHLHAIHLLCEVFEPD